MQRSHAKFISNRCFSTRLQCLRHAHKPAHMSVLAFNVMCCSLHYTRLIEHCSHRSGLFVLVENAITTNGRCDPDTMKTERTTTSYRRHHQPSKKERPGTKESAINMNGRNDLDLVKTEGTTNSHGRHDQLKRQERPGTEEVRSSMVEVSNS